MLYWRMTLSGKTLREPVGSYDPSASPKSLQPTPRGYSIQAAIRAAEVLALLMPLAKLHDRAVANQRVHAIEDKRNVVEPQIFIRAPAQAVEDIRNQIEVGDDDDIDIRRSRLVPVVFCRRFGSRRILI